MNLQDQISRQRVKHIIASYQLDGSEATQFETRLNELLNRYPHPLVELALIETLVNQWLRIPLTKGLAFLSQVQEQLQTWEGQPIISTVTPQQFQSIAGLDPAPVFGSSDRPPVRPVAHPPSSS